MVWSLGFYSNAYSVNETWQIGRRVHTATYQGLSSKYTEPRVVNSLISFGERNEMGIVFIIYNQPGWYFKTIDQKY